MGSGNTGCLVVLFSAEGATETDPGSLGTGFLSGDGDNGVGVAHCQRTLGRGAPFPVAALNLRFQVSI